MNTSGMNLGPNLTRREQQIVAEISRGRTNREIARSLQISHQTIKSHLARITIRLGAVNRAGIVGLAFRDGWIAWQDKEIIFPRWHEAEFHSALTPRVQQKPNEPDAMLALRRAFAHADASGSAPG